MLEKEKIIELISSGDTRRALETLLSMDLLPKDRNVVVQIKASFEKLRSDTLKGILSFEQQTAEQNRINDRLLMFLDGDRTALIQADDKVPSRKWWQYVAGAGVLVGIVAGIIQIAGVSLRDYFAASPKTFTSTVKPYLPFKFPEKLNILIIPFHGFDICEKAAPCDNAFMKGIYRLTGADAEVSVVKDSLIDVLVPGVIDSLLETSMADVIVWGDYEKPVCENDTTKIYLNYKIKSGIPYISGIKEQGEEKVVAPLLDIASGRFLGNLEELVFWLLASNACYHSNFEKGLELFNKINLSKDLDIEIYKGLLLIKGTLNVELGRIEEGKKYLLNLWGIDSTSIWANGNLGILYYNQRDYDHAIEYVKRFENFKVLDIQYFNFYELMLELYVKTKQPWDKILRFANILLIFDNKHTRANQAIAAYYYDRDEFNPALHCINQAHIPPYTKSNIHFFAFKSYVLLFNNKFEDSYHNLKIAYGIDNDAKVIDLGKLRGLTLADIHVTTAGYRLSDVRKIETMSRPGYTIYDVGDKKLEIPSGGYMVIDTTKFDKTFLKFIYEIGLTPVNLSK